MGGRYLIERELEKERRNVWEITATFDRLRKGKRGRVKFGI